MTDETRPDRQRGFLGFVERAGNLLPDPTIIFVYLIFYRVIFGVDEVKWMLINAALGVLGIYSQIGWILGRFGKNIDDYPWYQNITPFLYYVLYTFLLRQFLLDLTRSRDNPARRALVNSTYVGVSLLVYGLMLWR